MWSLQGANHPYKKKSLGRVQSLFAHNGETLKFWAPKTSLVPVIFPFKQPHNFLIKILWPVTFHSEVVSAHHPIYRCQVTILRWRDLTLWKPQGNLWRNTENPRKSPGILAHSLRIHRDPLIFIQENPWESKNPQESSGIPRNSEGNVRNPENP